MPFTDRPRGTVVYVAGSMVPMVVVEPDTYRDGPDRARRRYIRLRPQSDPDDRGRWWRSDSVT